MRKMSNGSIDMTPVDVSKIKEGQVFKNYKALCEHLGEKTKAGDSKKSQIKRWERYFETKKSGHSIAIVSIHKIPKEVIDMRERGGNTVDYLNSIEYLILNLLAQEENNGKVFISKNKLLELLDMVNPNYFYGKYNKEKIAHYTSISNYSVNDFYNTTDNTLKRNLASALKSLKDKSLIFYKEVITVTVADTTARINMENKIEAIRKVHLDNRGRRNVVFDTSDTSVRSLTRPATDRELDGILRITKSTLREFGLKKISDVFATNQAVPFYGRVGDLLFKDYNIDNHYTCYEINFNHDNIVEEKKLLKDWAIEESRRIASVIDLNSDIVDRLMKNLNRRKEDAEFMFLETEKEHYAFRLTDEYTEEQKALMSIMLTFGAEILEDIIENNLTI